MSWEPVNDAGSGWSKVGADTGEGWTVISEGSCDSWNVITDDGSSDCLDWDSPNRVCWILDTGSWSDSCFWRDLSLWNDGQEPWSQAA